MNKRKFNISSILIPFIFSFFLSSCGLFSSDGELICDDLVMTDATGLIIGEKGNPSDQWEINSPIENELGQNLGVSVAYPNPVVNSGSTTLSFTLPNEMSVKVQMEDPSGGKDIITEGRYSDGSHLIDIELRSDGCFRFDFFFNDSSSSNAFGLVLSE